MAFAPAGSSTADFLRRVIVRDLETLRRELRAYPDERMIWACPAGAPNAAGTLALHLCGNLQHFIGAQLGSTGYVRNRDAEFADRDVPLAELELRIDRTRDAVQATLGDPAPPDLDSDYPLEVVGLRLSTGLFLLHLSTHLAYHLGQIDYHRRIVTGASDGVGAVSIPALADR
jgi:hypothetical protein